jgi:hypothetical protein
MSNGTETIRASIPNVLRHRNKKADVAEHPKAFGHVGLLFNEPPRQDRVVLHLVIRRAFIVTHVMENAMGHFSASTGGRLHVVLRRTKFLRG